MNQLGISLLILSILFFHVVRSQTQNTPSQDDGVSNFQPSLVVVIGILGLMFALTFVLLIFAKVCHMNPLASTNNHPTTLMRSRSRFSGIDKTAIESLPFFRFSSLKGSKEGLECAICLSKFEDIEILRLLPKCKHGFHIDCIDHWLEKHSSCPICRHKVNPQDETIFAYSNSLRMMIENSGLEGDESNIEIFVQREEENQYGSSRFSSSTIGSSFRKIGKSTFVKEEELLIQKSECDNNKVYHKYNHKITISDVVFKHRWSNVSSSEMINSTSSNMFKFNNMESFTRNVVENEKIMNIKEEMERKISFESKVNAINKIKFKSVLDSDGNLSSEVNHVNRGEKRSVSEIVGVSRFRDFDTKKRVFEDCCLVGNNVKEERMRKLWFPIARRTAEWFVNRERRSQEQSHNNKVPLERCII
ncbi:E3 ubiquitin-protein ligase ATL42 [Cicer arietinum]|uniref:E3 ubiquitin-protein ligase ATL42 n=1 Tax=Cicer arietinum TaxID=3827 RepID=UPI003CC67A2E